MKKITLICLITVFTLFGFGCDKPETESDLIESSYNIVNDMEGVTLTVKEDSVGKSGLTLMIQNSTNEVLQYGPFFNVEKAISDKWYEIPITAENASFHFVAYSLNANSSVEVETDWNWLYGDLDAGTYRIIKRLGKEQESDKDYYLSAEFEIK